jgi:alpha-beta hydrolase superfamily lysophospholipase
MFDPADNGVPYAELNLTTDDSLLLEGWYAPSADTPAHTVLIIHDLNQSKLLYMDQIRQLHDRGLNIYIFDLRAHGTSDGTEFSIGKQAVNDVRTALKELTHLPGTNKIILFGSGLGSDIAVLTALEDTLCAGLILENPVNSFSKYLNRYSYQKWGKARFFWSPVLKRKVQTNLQMPVSKINLSQLVKGTSIPMLFLTGSEDSISYTSETLMIYQNSVSTKKDLLLVRNAGHSNMAAIGGEKYYNRIATFVNVNFPKRTKTRSRKLALQ